MSKPGKILLPDGETYIAVLMNVTARHEDGTPSELQVQQNSDVKYDLGKMEKPQFVVAYVLDTCFPGWKV